MSLNRFFSRLLLLTLFAVAAGCSTGAGNRTVVWPPEPATAPPPPPQQQRPIPITPAPPPQIPKPVIVEPKPPPSYPKTAEQISGQAVVSLIKQARQARADSKPDQASAALERALRIEPRNYFVWSSLAGLYLEQQQFEQAESVALKSNSLARGNVYVELENWKTIATARQATGDAIGALQAQARIDEIQRMLAGAVTR